MLLSKIPIYQINATLLKNRSEITSTNLYIPISINKTQKGSEYLYVGKKLVVNVNNKVFEGTYQQKVSDNTEYLLIKDIDVLTDVSFNFNDTAIYNETEIINSENDLLTITDIKLKLLAIKNANGYKGQSGLILPSQVEAIDTLPFENNINSKYFNELTTNSILFYYEKNLNENFQTTFQLKHSLFNAEYLIKTHGSNFQIKQNRFSSALELNNLNIEISVNKINNNLNTKTVYQIVARLINIPNNLNTNVEKIICGVSIPSSESTLFSSTLPANYLLSNLQILISSKKFNRNILYYDMNGLVSVKDYEEIKLTGLNDLNQTWNAGYYYYDELNINDVIFNNIPNSLKNVFFIEVKRVSSEIMVQLLYILDGTNNQLRKYSRYRNSSTSVITVWTEYVTDKHKHNASDITTDANHQFVSTAQINQWNSVSSSQFWRDAVLSKTNLPQTTNNGDTRLVLSENKIYRYDTVTSKWILLNDVKLSREILSDKIRIKVNEGLTDQMIELPFVGQGNPGIVPTEFYTQDYQNYFEQQLNFTPSNAGAEVPTNYTKPLPKTFNVINYSDTDIKFYDGVTNYIVGDGTNTITFDMSVGYAQKITQTFFTQVDNNNVNTGVIVGYSFMFNSNGYSTKLIFPQAATVNVINNGTSTLLSNNELIPEVTKTYIVKIQLSTNNVTIIKLP